MPEGRKLSRAEARAQRRRHKVETAETPAAALDAAFDLLRASLRRREANNPAKADEMRTRITQQMLDTAQQLDRIKE